MTKYKMMILARGRISKYGHGRSAIWNPEADTYLKKLWNDKVTQEFIAQIFGVHPSNLKPRVEFLGLKSRFKNKIGHHIQYEKRKARTSMMTREKVNEKFNKKLTKLYAGRSYGMF